MNDGEKLLLARRRRGLAAWKLAVQVEIDHTSRTLRPVKNRSSVFFRFLAMAVAFCIVFNHAGFPTSVVALAAGFLFCRDRCRANWP